MNYKSRIIRESQEAFAGLKKLGVINKKQITEFENLKQSKKKTLIPNTKTKKAIKEAKSFKGRLFKTINAFMKNLEN